MGDLIRRRQYSSLRSCRDFVTRPSSATRHGSVGAAWAPGSGVGVGSGVGGGVGSGVGGGVGPGSRSASTPGVAVGLGVGVGVVGVSGSARPWAGAGRAASRSPASRPRAPRAWPAGSHLLRRPAYRSRRPRRRSPPVSARPRRRSGSGSRRPDRRRTRSPWAQWSERPRPPDDQGEARERKCDEHDPRVADESLTRCGRRAGGRHGRPLAREAIEFGPGFGRAPLRSRRHPRGRSRPLRGCQSGAGDGCAGRERRRSLGVVWSLGRHAIGRAPLGPRCDGRRGGRQRGGRPDPMRDLVGTEEGRVRVRGLARRATSQAANEGSPARPLVDVRRAFDSIWRCLLEGLEHLDRPLDLVGISITVREFRCHGSPSSRGAPSGRVGAC